MGVRDNEEEISSKIGYPSFLCLTGSRLFRCNAPTSDWDIVLVSVYPEILLSLSRERKLELYSKEYIIERRMGGVKVEVKCCPIEKIFSSIANFSPYALEIIIALANKIFVVIDADKKFLEETCSKMPTECLVLSLAYYAKSFVKRYLRALDHHVKRAFELLKILSVYFYLLEKRRIPPPDLYTIVENVDALDFTVSPYVKTFKDAALEFIAKRRSGEIIPKQSIEIILRSVDFMEELMMRALKNTTLKELGKMCDSLKRELLLKFEAEYRRILKNALAYPINEEENWREVLQGIISLVNMQN